ncbi:diguanylate cyclase [Nodosilinea sp. LEGE 07088]|uniref:diguanylate cyclase domain-containing protein n=1 Tax=Nodosilinea sp. LEGE 07088 TaxID=2777968 RepID=UPI0019DD7699|nr:diguanylate cyclase [Nodosilinea sp. LEGE 07088]MBE9140550.1 diguanylate cyclase [Nodosilinea sp. LEGE 07088]
MLHLILPLKPVPKPPFYEPLSGLLRPFSLRTVLAAVFVLQIASAAGLLGLLTFYLGSWQIGLLSLGAIATSAVIGLAVVNRILQPIAQLQRALQAAARGDWRTPVPVDNPDELGQLALAFNRMAARLHDSFTELEHLNHEMQHSERRWRHFLDGIPLGIAVYDRSGQMVFASEQARILLCLEDMPSVPSLSLEETFIAYRTSTGDRYPTETLPIAQALRGAAGWADDLELRPGNRSIPIEIVTTPIFDQAGQVEYAIAAFQDITTRKQAQTVLANYSQTLEHQVADRTAALRQAEATQRIILAAIPDLLVRFSGEGVCLDVMNAGAVEPIAAPKDQIGKAIGEVLPPQMAAERMHYIRLALQTGQTQVYEYKFQLPTGVRYEEARIVPSGSNQVLAIVRDITERKRAEAEIASQRQFLQNVIDSIPSIIVVKDRDDRVKMANRASATLHGITPQDMVGKRDHEFNANISAFEVARQRHIHQQVIATRTPYQGEQEIIDRAGVRRWYQVVISPFRAANGVVNGVITNCIDITDRKSMETALTDANKTLEQLATLDGLTHISNRRRFDDYLEQEWQRMVREQQPLSLIMFDVDYFKPYNDSLGHQQGDEALIAIAAAATQAVKRAADLLARYGGEEFAVVLPNTRRTGAEIVAQAIKDEIAALALPHPESSVSDYLTVSIGIASVVPTADQSPDDLIAAADSALYQAKRRGRDRYWIRLI